MLLEIATPKGLFEGVFTEKTTISQVIEIVVEDKKLTKKTHSNLSITARCLSPLTGPWRASGLGTRLSWNWWPPVRVYR